MKSWIVPYELTTRGEAIVEADTAEDAISDWTEVLDPAQVEAFRAILDGQR